MAIRETASTNKPIQIRFLIKSIIVTLCVCFFLIPAGHAQSRLNKSFKDFFFSIPSPEKLIIKYGIASYYAHKFQGRSTATGETYSHESFTAACNVLPLNTWIRITNLSNNKSVIARVNDRLHPKSKRLVDLSKSAAQRLGYISRGLTDVKVEVMSDYNPSAANPQD